VPIQSRLAQVRQELTQILSLAQRCDIAALFPNRAGDFRGAIGVGTAQEIIGGLDPRMIGYYFRSGGGCGGKADSAAGKQR